MPKQYGHPTMVSFCEVGNQEDTLYGIAFEDHVICSCCGNSFSTYEILIIEEHPWIDFSGIFESHQ